MNPLTLNCARALRDGGIDAAAALDHALMAALVGLPEDAQADLKRAIGHVMSAVFDATVNPAVRAFPELKPDAETWAAIVKDRATARAEV